MQTWAIIPVKALSAAKQRLSPVLPPAIRRRLVLTMLEDVLALLRGVNAIQQVVVVTPDADVEACARAGGASVLREPRGALGLNAAARTGLMHAAGNGADRALVLPADVPLATAAELESLLAATGARADARIAIVPSADGGGTNALLLAPPNVLELSFGPGSFVNHLASAVARKLDTEVLQLAGLGADIDEPRDLAQLVRHERYAFLRPHLPRDPAAPRSATQGNER